MESSAGQWNSLSCLTSTDGRIFKVREGSGRLHLSSHYGEHKEQWADGLIELYDLENLGCKIAPGQCSFPSFSSVHLDVSKQVKQRPSKLPSACNSWSCSLGLLSKETPRVPILNTLFLNQILSPHSARHVEGVGSQGDRTDYFYICFHGESFCICLFCIHTIGSPQMFMRSHSITLWKD